MSGGYVDGWQIVCIIIHCCFILQSYWLVPMKYYIIITIVQSYTRKYHTYVSACIVTSAQHE